MISLLLLHIVQLTHNKIVSDNLVADHNGSNGPERIPVLLPLDLVSDKIPVTVPSVSLDPEIAVQVLLNTASCSFSHHGSQASSC